MIKSNFKIAPFAFLIFFTSCVNTRKATYFNDLPDETISYQIENLEPVIQKNDLLSITVSSLNPEATQLFNLHNTSSDNTEISGTLSKSSGYLVDQDGNIQFPMLGNIKAAGMNKKQLKEYIVSNLVKKNVLFDPIVSIRYLNYKVTVLGEVNRPSVINVPNEKITLLEAIGLAGDLTLYAKRDNILIIHEEEGKRTTKHVNLNDNELLTSPYYFLKSNDVVYVAPNKSRVESTGRASTWVPALLGAVSFMIIIIDHVLK